MSLFPAYSTEPMKDGVKATGERIELIEMVQSEDSDVEAAGVAVAVSEEAALLASESSGDEVAPPAKVARPAAPPLLNEDFYVDGKRDVGNLGVTTLYYPGRPIYTRPSMTVLGAAGGTRSASGKSKASRRYYLYQEESGNAAPDAAEVAARARSYRDMLAHNPTDQELWLRYIYFQEVWGSGAEWISACEEGVRSVEGAASGAGGARLRSALHRARRAHRSHGDLLKDITSDIACEKNSSIRLEHWLRLVWSVAAGEGGAADVQGAARAALSDAPCDGRAYPPLLYAYGCSLRAAGLWEQLVLLVELVCAMNCPPCATFPPSIPPEELLAQEQRLLDAEDKVIDSGLPLSAVWVRVERLRAAAHWRGVGEGEGAEGADPQRAPPPADVAPLLCAVRPDHALHVAVALLRLAQVPVLPMSESAARACAAGEGETLGATLLALSRAARRLPPAHPTRAAGRGLAERLPALLDPPHYFTDDYGFLSWVEGLWEKCLGWVEGRGRVALVCWRLRWLHALARLTGEGEGQGEEGRRLRARARHVFKQHAAGEPVAAALYARIERDAGRGEAALRAAAQAVRTAVGASSVPVEHALFCARVLRSVAPNDEALCRTALCCAVLRRAMPLAGAAPSEDTMQAARDTCSRMCEELERRFETEKHGDGKFETDTEWGVLSAGVGEWGAARAALLSPGKCREELDRMFALPYALVHKSAQSVQYYEQSALALARALGSLSAAAPRLQPLFPNNGLIALACAGRGAGPSLPSPLARLAQVLPALLQASFDYADEDAVGMKRVARRCGTGGGTGEGEAALCALRLEAEARGGAPPARLHRLLYAALADLPNHKWLYVRGAEWVPQEAAALCDVALERGLRAHALLHELRPAPPQ